MSTSTFGDHDQGIVHVHVHGHDQGADHVNVDRDHAVEDCDESREEPQSSPLLTWIAKQFRAVEAPRLPG